MRKPVRIIVLIFFVVTVAISVAVSPNLAIGLDKKYSMPDDSYVLKYFEVRNFMVKITFLKT